jgi:hypothetical protein
MLYFCDTCFDWTADADGYCDDCPCGDAECTICK